MQKILVVGEVLVEIMADAPGNGFLEPIALTGPFPSGAPAIFIDQVARLGQPGAILATVGDDDFGRLNVARLDADGVDVSGIAVDPERPTGSAFVRYREDGSRDFVFNLRHSACGAPLKSEAIDRAIASANHLHVMGSSLSAASIATLNLDLAERIRAAGGTVSFDPNVRKEMLDAPGVGATMRRLLALTDLFLPSGDELQTFFPSPDDDTSLRLGLDSGIGTIVYKRGRLGARAVDRNADVSVAAFTVDEIDPTGAGDCFGATFATMWLRSRPLLEALTLAAAAGAMAVTRRGPMEGAGRLTELQRFIDTRENG